LFELLAKRPEDVREAGGVQRQWALAGHRSPSVLEIDFGELLRGRVGGDFAELAGVINYYLEADLRDASPADDILTTLVRALDSAADDARAVAAVLRELRAAVFMTTAMEPERLDDLFKRAALVGSRLSAGVAGALLALRGTAEATVGQTDVVTSLFDRMDDDIVSSFLAQAVSGSIAPQQIKDVFVSLVPEPERRKRLLDGAFRGTAMDADTLAKWEEFAQHLEDLSERKFISDQYAHEIETARTRSASEDRAMQDPPERIAAWLRSIDDRRVHDLDVELLADYLKVESDTDRWCEFLPIARQFVIDAGDAGDWDATARVAEAIAREAGSTYDDRRRQHGREVLQQLAVAPMCERALTSLVEGRDPAGFLARTLQAIGPALVPVIARRWAGATDEHAVARLGLVVAAFGRAGREPMRRLLGAPEPALRIAAMRMLDHLKATDHLPSLEPMLSDDNAGVQQTALRALATADSERAHEILIRGVVKADRETQGQLLEDILALGSSRAATVLRQLLGRLDQRTAPPGLYLAVIDGLRRIGNAEAVSALGTVFEQRRWRAPVRSWRFRSAARAALRAIGGTAAVDAATQAAEQRDGTPRRASVPPAGGQPAPAAGTDS
jgi:hypothetical protein